MIDYCGFKDSVNQLIFRRADRVGAPNGQILHMPRFGLRWHAGARRAPIAKFCICRGLAGAESLELVVKPDFSALMLLVKMTNL